MYARLVTALVGAVVVTAGALTASPAYADTVAKGPGGQRLTVSKTSNLPRAGTTLTVSGSGYDITKGIYVAYCVDNGNGVAPSPCGGGIDMGGTSGASHWISSNPPSYGEGLAVPYGPGGSFRVQLKVTAKIGDVDCTVRRCVVASRNDHTRSSDRSQDVRVPVTFANPAVTPPKTGAPAPAAPKPTTGAATAAAGRPTAGAPAATVGATGAVAGAGTPGASGAPGRTSDPTDPVATTRISDSASTGRWWTAVMAGLGALLVVLVALRVRGRRREQP